MTKKKIERASNEDFIRIWEASASRADAAHAAGMTSINAGVRASQMRSKGIALKLFKKGRKFDTQALKAILASIRKK